MRVQCSAGRLKPCVFRVLAKHGVPSPPTLATPRMSQSKCATQCEGRLTCSASLQVDMRAKTGPWLLRPVWRALFWAITEAPAHLEAMMPPPPAISLAALGLAPEQSDGSGQCAWAPSATRVSGSRAASTHMLATGAAESVLVA